MSQVVAGYSCHNVHVTCVVVSLSYRFSCTAPVGERPRVVRGPPQPNEQTLAATTRPHSLIPTLVPKRPRRNGARVRMHGLRTCIACTCIACTCTACMRTRAPFRRGLFGTSVGIKLCGRVVAASVRSSCSSAREHEAHGEENNQNALIHRASPKILKLRQSRPCGLALV